MTSQVTDTDLRYLRRCVELAAEAVESGDFPFGSVLVTADGMAGPAPRFAEQVRDLHREFHSARR